MQNSNLKPSRIITAVAIILGAIVNFCIAKSMWINVMPPQTESLFSKLLRVSSLPVISLSIATTLAVYLLDTFALKRKINPLKYIILLIVSLAINFIIFSLNIEIAH